MCLDSSSLRISLIIKEILLYKLLFRIEISGFYIRCFSNNLKFWDNFLKFVVLKGMR